MTEQARYSEKYETLAEESAYKKVGTDAGNLAHRINFWGGSATGEGADMVVEREPRRDWKLVQNIRVEILDSEKQVGYCFKSDTNRNGTAGYIVEAPQTKTRSAQRKLVGYDGLMVAIENGWVKSSFDRINKSGIGGVESVKNFDNVASRHS